MDEIAKAASVMGKKGGAKTALLGHDYYSVIGKKAAQTRWGKKKQKSQELSPGSDVLIERPVG